MSLGRKQCFFAAQPTGFSEPSARPPKQLLAALLLLSAWLSFVLSRGALDLSEGLQRTLDGLTAVLHLDTEPGQ